MKTKLTYIIITAVALVTLGTGVALAWGSCYSKIDRIPGITLDDKQRAALNAKEDEHQKAMIRLKADFDIARVEKQALLKNKEFNKKDVQKQIDKMGGIKAEMQKAKLDALDNVRQILTDEQWALFNDAMGKKGYGKKGKNCMRSGMAKGGHHGGDYGAGYHGRAKSGCPYSQGNPVIEE